MIRTAAQILSDVEASAQREPLTDRQRHIVDFIAAFIVQHHYPPTVREIGAAVGLTAWSAVAYQIAELEGKGFLTRKPGRSRTIALVDRNAEPSQDGTA
jgi:repressor LexA